MADNSIDPGGNFSSGQWSSGPGGQIQTQTQQLINAGVDPNAAYAQATSNVGAGGGGYLGPSHQGGGGGQPQVQQANMSGTEVERYIAALQKATDALASGNAQAFARAVQEFDLEFGLKRDQFAENIRQFNQNFGLAQSGVTGMYQGQPTLPAMTSYASQFGQWGVPTQGQATLAAQQQAYAQQMGMISQAAGLQANPFRQQQVLGQMGNLLGGGGVAGFQAPNMVAGVGTQGGNTQGGMGYLQQMINDIRDPTPNSTSMSHVLNAIPTPNKLNSIEFLQASPSTQSMVLQGMQEKFGLDPADSMKQIQNTLPQFNAPNTVGQVRR